MYIVAMTNLISWTFVIFLVATLIIHYAVPRRFQWIVILIANCVFYAFGGFKHFFFIITTALASFYGAVIVEKLHDTLKSKKKALKQAGASQDEIRRATDSTTFKCRLVLVAFLLITLGMLVVLKRYINIPLVSALSIAFPLGISFYTFSTISYFMDVYNKKYKREHNFFRYFSFVSFFPQLIMGPINRYDRLGKNLNEQRSFDFDNIKRGVLLFLFGAMKKYCIADLLSNKMDPILQQGYTSLPGGLALFGVLIYAIYQYADFSGGIDMVMGVAALFGVKMEQNFRQPYFSTSLADFWRRWHISLGLFMRDYVFYPLALTKPMQRLTKTIPNKHLSRSVTGGICNIVVFFLVGLWHGNTAHFIVWGLYNGIIIAASDALRPFFEKINAALHINAKSRGFHVFQIVRTFAIVNFGWYFDKIEDVRFAFLYLKRTFTAFGDPRVFLTKQYIKNIFGSLHDLESQLILIFISLVITFIISVKTECGEDVYSKIKGKPIALRYVAFYVPLLLVILSFSFSPGNPVFMYAQY